MSSNLSVNQIIYTLQLADNALIIGHRLSEWCGHGPVLEQDIALANIALDHLGQARSFYQYAAEQFNRLSSEDKNNLFSSVTLQQKIAKGANLDEDDLAYLRDGWDFYNLLLVEQPNKDWAYTVARSFFYDTFNYHFYTSLQKSKDERLSAIAEKSLKEVAYHLRWSHEWILRLGDGTEESHARMQEAINERWMFTGEMFTMTHVEQTMLENNIGVNPEEIKSAWLKQIENTIYDATLSLSQNNWMQSGGKEGRHTEHLGYLLAELQFMQRAYPDMKW